MRNHNTFFNTLRQHNLVGLGLLPQSLSVPCECEACGGQMRIVLDEATVDEIARAISDLHAEAMRVQGTMLALKELYLRARQLGACGDDSTGDVFDERDARGVQ